MTHLDLFSGIGGFALAAQEVWADDYQTLAFCDNDPFCQQVLKKNFPSVPVFGDIRTLANSKGQQAHSAESGGLHAQPSLPNRAVDLLTGGFPCQPFSQAGRRRGAEDDRYLWPEMLRVIREFRPTWIIGENVAGIISMALDQVLSDLEGEGYTCQAFVLPACALNAPHRRDRVWIVGHAADNGQHGTQDGQGRAERGYGNTEGQEQVRQPEGTGGLRDDASNPKSRRFSEFGGSRRGWSGLAYPNWNRDWREVAAATCHDRVDDGLPKRVVRLPDGSTISQSRWRQEALKAYGNAIVPQVAIEVMKAIRDYD